MAQGTIINSVVSNVLNTKDVDVSSMQIGDALLLVAKQARQIKALSEYIVLNSKLAFAVTRADEYMFAGQIQICKVEFTQSQCKLIFDRNVMFCTADNNDGTFYEVSLEDNIAIIENLDNVTTLYINIL